MIRTMGNTSLFKDILKDIDATNVKEKLAALETGSKVKKLALFNNVVDVVYSTDNGLLLVLCDFLPLSENKDWLADEEMTGGEPPLYFSTASHRISPIYHLRRAKAFFSRFFPQPSYHIDMLLICNYNIINFEDMRPVWKDMDATIVHHTTDAPPLFPEKKEKQDAALYKEDKDLTEDEFERLLNDFIGQEGADNTGNAPSAGDAPTAIEALSEKPEHGQRLPPREPVSVCFKVKALKLFKVTSEHNEFLSQEAVLPSLKAFNTHGLKEIGVSAVIGCKYYQEPDADFIFNLYHETGRQLMQGKARCTFSVPKHDKEARITALLCPDEGVLWKRGRYLLELLLGEETLATFTFHIGSQDVEGEYGAEEESPQPYNRPFEALERMVGLRQVKERMKQYRDAILFAQKRKAKGLQTEQPSLHAVFMGSPGTGKTTVARLYGAILKELGLLSSGHVVFRERSTLLGQNYSSEQENTLEAIKEAQGGVLFIDEAYALYKAEDTRDPGRNVLETLLTAMENGKQNWALVLAGYADAMPELLSSNQGFSSRIPLQNRYYFEDYSVEELMKIAGSYCEARNYVLTAEARKALRNKISHDYSRKDRTFGNGRYIINLLTNDILQAMSLRVARIKNPTLLQLITIEKGDIPGLRLKDYKKPLKKLHDMVGLSNLKRSIGDHLNMVRMFMLRNEQGIHTELPPLHMVFTGNPGTGKTTVADLIGEIYASLGLLSVGKVIHAERKDLVGAYIGDTERKTEEMLKRAQGNVLFIDEAYSLCCDTSSKKDFGYRVLEILLTALGRDHIDMLVILAGYPEEMEQLLQANPGLKSRIPYTFHFEDYTTEELISIAKETAAQMEYKFTPAALKALRNLIEKKMEDRDTSWGNARFVTRLISNTIIPAMSTRLLALPPHKLKDKKTLLTICRADIPTTEEAQKDNRNGFDEPAIQRSLKKLDSLVGLSQVKQNIYNLVDVARHLYQTGRSYSGCCSLRWDFTGNTGTGKSTVAGIMGELLRAMNILEKGHLVEIKAETFYNVSEYKADEILKSAINRSCQGILFIDGDAPLFSRPGSPINNESLRFKLSSIMAEAPGIHALIIATNESRTPTLAHNLRMAGKTGFDHTFFFDDYTEQELCEILAQCLKKKKLQLSRKASEHIARYIHSLCTRRELGYANARTMKLIADSIAETHWLHIGTKRCKRNEEVAEEEVESFVWQDAGPRTHIGYR